MVLLNWLVCSDADRKLAERKSKLRDEVAVSLPVDDLAADKIDPLQLKRKYEEALAVTRCPAVPGAHWPCRVKTRATCVLKTRVMRMRKEPGNGRRQAAVEAARIR